MISLCKTYLGIELGSTRIKAVLINDDLSPVAYGSHEWENRLENGFWTYSEEDIVSGLRSSFASLAEDVFRKYGTQLTTVGAMGVSAMMHGYIALDENDRLAVPFRTWRNTTAARAAEELSRELGFNIPMRWSIAHLGQAAADCEEHLPTVRHITTLAGYVNYLLTGERAVGVGDASGIFPIENGCYSEKMLAAAQKWFSRHGFEKSLSDILPPVKSAGAVGAVLTEAGAALLDPSGRFKAGVPVCPPEGDAGTGMVAANAVRAGTGNVSAGTSVFSMLVLKEPLTAYYPEIDIVTTPDGTPAAMVHCNNCCAELDMWVEMFCEFSRLCGTPCERSRAYELLYTRAMSGRADCAGITAFNYLSGEPVTGVLEGRPMYFRTPGERAGLAEFFRAQLYSAFASLKIGMDILFEKENAAAEQFTAHGGIFKVKGAASQVLADALKAPVSVMQTAGEGGAWGMALLAAYMVKGGGAPLDDWLSENVFCGMEQEIYSPTSEGTAGFEKYIARYKPAAAAQKILSEVN